MTDSPVRRQTRQRGLVHDKLKEMGGFVSANKLHMELAENKIGLATIYRHLNDMVAAGDADTIASDGGEQLFRLCGSEHHHHLVCRVCGRTVEIEAPPIEQWVQQMARSNDYFDVEHVVELVGVCAECHSR